MYFVINKQRSSCMTNLTSKAALFMLLLVPCKAFGGVTDVASKLVAIPVTMVKSSFGMAMDVVDGVAGLEEAAFSAITEFPMKGVRGAMELADEHSQTLWRIASVASLAYAFRYAQNVYMKNCPMACKK
jgi:hypothetical protein